MCSSDLLTLSGKAPTLIQSNGATIAPDVGHLELVGYAPTITVTGNQNLTPEAGRLSLSGYAPTLEGDGLQQHGGVNSKRKRFIIGDKMHYVTQQQAIQIARAHAESAQVIEQGANDSPLPVVAVKEEEIKSELAATTTVVPPVFAIEDAIALAASQGKKQEALRMEREMAYAALMASVMRWQDDEDVEMLLMAA